jgi:hypothetical protein
LFFLNSFGGFSGQPQTQMDLGTKYRAIVNLKQGNATVLGKFSIFRQIPTPNAPDFVKFNVEFRLNETIHNFCFDCVEKICDVI